MYYKDFLNNGEFIFSSLIADKISKNYKLSEFNRNRIMLTCRNKDLFNALRLRLDNDNNFKLIDCIYDLVNIGFICRIYKASDGFCVSISLQMSFTYNPYIGGIKE